MANQRVIVVGGGLAGLAAAVRIGEAGVPVDLFSLVPVKRSHSVCAQSGINACNEVARQQGYSEYEHFDESIYGGDFLANQPPVMGMAAAAPGIVSHRRPSHTATWPGPVAGGSGRSRSGLTTVGSFNRSAAASRSSRMADISPSARSKPRLRSL